MDTSLRLMARLVVRNLRRDNSRPASESAALYGATGLGVRADNAGVVATVGPDCRDCLAETQETR